jgi:membrane associated rhomboid family serine protease
MLSITLIIIISTCLVSFSAFGNERMKENMLFWPAEIDSQKQYYRFLTYGLIHADLIHLAFNMIALYSFGEYVERYLFSHPDLFAEKGKLIYLVLYISAIIISPLPDYFKHRNSYAYRALGASGAVSAIVFAGIMLQPKLPIQILFIPFDIPGYIFGVIFLLLSVVLARKGGDNIGHGAHFTGAIYGLVFTIVTTRLIADFDAVSSFVNSIMNR